MSIPKVQPINLKEHSSKQSRYDQCAKLPMRSIVLGPSGSGKTILLQNMILDIYEGCFDKIYIFSPSVNLDHAWNPVKEYIKDTMKIKDDDEELLTNPFRIFII
jgi:DNA replication protein DnaC